MSSIGNWKIPRPVDGQSRTTPYFSSVGQRRNRCSPGGHGHHFERMQQREASPAQTSSRKSLSFAGVVLPQDLRPSRCFSSVRPCASTERADDRASSRSRSYRRSLPSRVHPARPRFPSSPSSFSASCTRQGPEPDHVQRHPSLPPSRLDDAFLETTLAGSATSRLSSSCWSSALDNIPSDVHTAVKAFWIDSDIRRFFAAPVFRTLRAGWLPVSLLGTVLRRAF